MGTKHYLFHVLGITPKSRAKVCAQLRVLKPPGSLLLTILRQGFWLNSCFMLIGVGAHDDFVLCC